MPSKAPLIGQRQQPGRARVSLLVHGMSEARKRCSRVLEPLQVRAGHLRQGAWLSLAVCDDAAEQQTGRLRCAQDHRPTAQQPSRYRALQRLRRCRKRHARGLHRRDQAMLGDGHQGGVGRADQVLRRRLSGEQEEEIGGEGLVAHEAVTQVLPANDDPVAFDLGHVAGAVWREGARGCGLAHGASVHATRRGVQRAPARDFPRMARVGC